MVQLWSPKGARLIAGYSVDKIALALANDKLEEIWEPTSRLWSMENQRASENMEGTDRSPPDDKKKNPFLDSPCFAVGCFGTDCVQGGKNRKPEGFDEEVTCQGASHPHKSNDGQSKEAFIRYGYFLCGIETDHWDSWVGSRSLPSH